MAGDERVRHCTLCSLNVYNFAEMTHDEVRALLVKTEGRLCARLYQRADGTLLTSDCPSGLRALRQRMSRLGAAVIAAMFSLSAFASDKSCEKPRLKKNGSKVQLEIERVVTPQRAMFTGAVFIEAENSSLPGATVVLRDETLQQEITAVTDVNGAFTFGPLNEGIYRVEVTLSGFLPAVMEHITLKQHELTHARVALRLDPNMITIGIVTVDPLMTNPGMSTTFSQDLINKLPI